MGSINGPERSWFFGRNLYSVMKRGFLWTSLTAWVHIGKNVGRLESGLARDEEVMAVPWFGVGFCRKESQVYCSATQLGIRLSIPQSCRTIRCRTWKLRILMVPFLSKITLHVILRSILWTGLSSIEWTF